MYEREETYAPLFAPRQSLSCDPAKFVSPACRFKVSAVARKENLPQGGGWCQPNSSFFISLLRPGWERISVYRPQARLFRDAAKITLTPPSAGFSKSPRRRCSFVPYPPVHAAGQVAVHPAAQAAVHPAVRPQIIPQFMPLVRPQRNLQPTRRSCRSANQCPINSINYCSTTSTEPARRFFSFTPFQRMRSSTLTLCSRAIFHRLSLACTV